MADNAKLTRLLDQVVFDESCSAVDGIDPFRDLLKKDVDGRVMRFLNQSLPKVDANIRGALAFLLAEHYLEVGDVARLRRLFAFNDASVKEGTLNGLWGEPDRDSSIAKLVVELAIEGAQHASPEVRTEACYVIMNQAGWGVDVSTAVESVKRLLSDPSDRVRMQAACAAAHLAKKRYDVASFVPQLRRNLKRPCLHARKYTAWALWQFSKGKIDIGPAIAGLVALLGVNEENNEHRKNAAGALLHHAKKSDDNAEQVRSCVQGKLDCRYKEVVKFLDQLAKLP